MWKNKFTRAIFYPKWFNPLFWVMSIIILAVSLFVGFIDITILVFIKWFRMIRNTMDLVPKGIYDRDFSRPTKTEQNKTKLKGKLESTHIPPFKK